MEFTVGMFLGYLQFLLWQIFGWALRVGLIRHQWQKSLSKIRREPYVTKYYYFVLSLSELHLWSSKVFVHVVFMVRLVKPTFLQFLNCVDFFFSCWFRWNCWFKTHFYQLKIIIIPYQILISLKFITHS